MRRALAVVVAVLASAAVRAEKPAPAASRRAPLVLVAQKQAGTVMIIDPAARRTLATLPTGTGPHEIAVAPGAKTAVVANYGNQGSPGSSLTVVDIDARKVARTIDLGAHRRPHGLAFLPDGQLLVTVEQSQAVLVVDVAGGKVVKVIKTDQPGTHMVVASADGKRAYTTNIPAGSVSLLDVVAGKVVKTEKVAPHVEGIALSPDGRQVWVGSNEADSVTVLDGATLAKVGAIQAAGLPIRVTASPDGKRVLVTNANGGKLQIVDAATRTVSATVAFPSDPKSLPEGAPGVVPIGTVITPDGKTAYVSLLVTGKVAVIDLDTAKIVHELPAGEAPDGIALAVL
jgi:YVTN family beta-propeller protein